jgi:hypothetical protein
VTLNNVLHVPRLFTNILSTGKVQQHRGYFDGQTYTFRRIDTDQEFGSTQQRKGFWLLNF